MAPRRQRGGSAHTPTPDESGEAERIGETGAKHARWRALSDAVAGHAKYREKRTFRIGLRGVIQPPWGKHPGRPASSRSRTGMALASTASWRSFSPRSKPRNHPMNCCVSRRSFRHGSTDGAGRIDCRRSATLMEVLRRQNHALFEERRGGGFSQFLEDAGPCSIEPAFDRADGTAADFRCFLV